MLKTVSLFVALAGLAAGAWAADDPAPTPKPTPTSERTHAAHAGARKEARSALTFLLGLDLRHDDNILQMTQHNLDRFAANPSPPRFLVRSPEDEVRVLRGDLRWRTRLLPRRETRLGLSANIDRYRRNSVKNWEDYALSLKQEVTASRRHLATLELHWNTVPRFYLGQITDADDSFAAGRRIRRPLRYAQTGVGVRWAQELLPGRLALGLGRERLHRDYDSHFDERDNDNDSWRFEAELRPFRGWGLEAGVTYLRGTLAARGDLATSPIRDTDISYRHRGLGASLTLPWGHGASRGRAEIGWMPEARQYTTQDKFDVSRFGRVNHRREIDVKVTQSLWGPFELIANYDHLASDASFPAGIDFPEDVSDFQQTRTGVMLRGSWDLWSR